MQSIDSISEVTATPILSSVIDVSKRLQPNEAFKVVVGDEVYSQPWAAADRSKVLTAAGEPIDKAWSEIHPETGADTSLVTQLIAFSCLAVQNRSEQGDVNVLTAARRSTGAALVYLRGSLFC
jgi:hypothetical protein